ncbi:Aldo/keto reductase [Athelia psychrophila]|uniref:Aldo/keto reductase n=1 Tax=Athelia psychrophila TaxID=1759441 RepID=A0A167UHJ7_9AGAM|nr:Aldo/keto reductase [Fibularhizoctonia sp. CBS 109695]
MAQGTSKFYGSSRRPTGFWMRSRLYASGCKFIDTSDAYGDSARNSLEGGAWLKRTGTRAAIFLATKFGFTDSGTDFGRTNKINHQIDLYYLHRADPLVPVEVALLQPARELGVKIVAHTPLGRGMPSDALLASVSRFLVAEGLGRQVLARELPEHPQNILKLGAGLQDIGKTHAWLLAQGDDVLPIPGTKTIKYLQENLGAAKVQLTPEDLLEVRKVAVAANVAQGGGTIRPL